MKKLDALIIEPSIISGDGHHYPYLHRHRAVLAGLGIEVISATSMNIDREFARRTGLIPAFQKSLHGRGAYTAAEFVEFATTFERDLMALLIKHRLRPDIIILPTADQVMLLGLAMLLKKSTFKPEVLAWILTSPHHLKPADDPSVGPRLSEYADAFAGLCLATGNRLHLFTEANAMAAVYQPHCAVKIQTVTVRKRLQRPRPRRVRRLGQRINLVCVGVAAKSKGYALLPETIRLLNAARGDLQFSIHGTVAHTGFSEIGSIMEGLHDLAPNVDVCTDNLSAEDYTAWLSDADIAMLPYDTYVYRTHGSAVFDECVGLGVPVVAPSDCDFAKNAIAGGRAVGLDSLTPESLTAAVLAAIDRLDGLAERAARYAESRTTDNTLVDTISAAAAAAEQRLSWLDRAGKRWRRLRAS